MEFWADERDIFVPVYETVPPREDEKVSKLAVGRESRDSGFDVTSVDVAWKYRQSPLTRWIVRDDNRLNCDVRISEL